MKNLTASGDLTQACFLGLDVHKKTIVVAQAQGCDSPRYVATLKHEHQVIEKFFQKILQSNQLVFSTYEAGGCGYGLARQLEKLGITNLIAAPSKIVKPKGSLKNDKHDAIHLTRLLRNHVLLDQKELHEVYLPDPDDEAVREKTRQRHAFKRQVQVTRNQILGMLTRQGKRYNLTKTHWTQTHRKWMESAKFGHPFLDESFRIYLDQLNDLETRVDQCDLELERIRKVWSKGPIVTALMALRGISLLAAISIVSEIGCFSRFDSAAQFMAFLGLTPSEHSSGDRVTRGRITKKGNSKVRSLLVEASCCANRTLKSKDVFVKKCPAHLPVELTNHAYKAQHRLYKTYWKLVHKGKNTNVARIAVARELAGFVWAIGVASESKLQTKTTS